jgi:hypothetical protein
MLLERTVGPMRVVVADVLAEDSFQVLAREIRVQSKHSRRMLPSQRSACAFARGAATGAR